MFPDKSSFSLVFIFLLINLVLGVASAQEENMEEAEKIMVFQIEALKAKDRERFVKYANRAFRDLMDEYMFDSLFMQRRDKVNKGYKLEYLGNIRSIGTLEYLWKIHINGEKYQLLGRLTLSHGKVVGFSLE